MPSECDSGECFMGRVWWGVWWWFQVRCLPMVSVVNCDAVDLCVFWCVFWGRCRWGCMVVVSCAMFAYGFCGEMRCL